MVTQPPPWQPIPPPNHSFCEDFFPISSLNLLVQLEAVSSCPVTVLLGEEADPLLATITFQASVESDKEDQL